MAGRNVKTSLPGSSRPAGSVLVAAGAAILFVVGLTAPTFVQSSYVFSLGVGSALLAILAMAIAFLMHQLGLVMFGIAAYYGTAAYVFAIIVKSEALGVLAAAVVAVGATAAFAFLVGALIVRTKPLAFMMLTLAIGEMLRHATMLSVLRPFTGGADGLVVSPGGALFGEPISALTDPRTYWCVMWVALWIAALLFWSIGRSYFGHVMQAIKQNEERMRFSGFNTGLPRLLAFTLVGTVAGVAGVLHVLHFGFVSPELMGLGTSTNALVSAIVGGVATTVGPIVGAVAYYVAQDEFGAQGYSQLFTGIAIVLVIWLFPRGLMGIAAVSAAGWRSVSRLVPKKEGVDA